MNTNTPNLADRCPITGAREIVDALSDAGVICSDCGERDGMAAARAVAVEFPELPLDDGVCIRCCIENGDLEPQEWIPKGREGWSQARFDYLAEVLDACADEPSKAGAFVAEYLSEQATESGWSKYEAHLSTLRARETASSVKENA